MTQEGPASGMATPEAAEKSRQAFAAAGGKNPVGDGIFERLMAWQQGGSTSRKFNVEVTWSPTSIIVTLSDNGLYETVRYLLLPPAAGSEHPNLPPLSDLLQDALSRLAVRDADQVDKWRREREARERSQAHHRVRSQAQPQAQEGK